MTKTKAQEEKPELVPEQPTTSPRKRRRRAPATGAADDCFTCQERHRKCDRKRPYCTQCLDHGKDCSGYKTALTWNVGVASRGKLRGLSLPIAKSKKVEQSSEPKSSKKRSASSQMTEQSPSRRDSQHPPSGQPFSTGGNAGTTRYSFISMDPTSTTTSPMLPPPNLVWPPTASHTQDGTSTRHNKRVRRHSLRPLQVPAYQTARGLEGLPMSAHALGGYADHDFGVSVECSPTASSFAGFEPSYKDYSCTPIVLNPFEGNFFTGHETVGWPRDNMSSSLSSDQSSRDYPDDEAFFADPVVSNTLDDILSAQHALNNHDLSLGDFAASADNPKFRGRDPSAGLVSDDCGAHPSLTLSRSLPSLSIGKTPGLQVLIDYYDKVISPVIVAFDGSSNPYRSHILRLAVESETLQHAIAALSASNLRQRRAYHAPGSSWTRQSVATSSHDQSVRKSSIAHSMMDAGLDQHSQCSPNVPSIEEMYHKGASIKALNEQLADPTRRMDDSVLATLLILCLYHICDTGVGKFKTQFAGVKKILALRGGTAGSNSKATNWLTIMFTWFDAMTATVNDREGQLPGDLIDLSTGDGEEWALENLAGCDGRLFKIISKLGGLNLLSQNRPVRESSPSRTANVKVGPTPHASSKTQDYYSMNYRRFDGNGWSHLQNTEKTADEMDFRAQFWKEWSDIRKKLQGWQLDTPVPSATDSETVKGDRADLSHISESFRYSALLYTERLAYPHLPSAHPNFQHLVTQALYHIANVQSDVFLLWPLFITGAECVSEQSRFLIRERCLDIQKDSGFFNNISCLELLEKAWRDDLIDEPDDFGQRFEETSSRNVGGHGFKWRKAMERVDGEYIVV